MATHLPVIGGHAEGFAKTARTDDWRSGPAITFIVFTTFVVYTTWAAFQGNHYYVDPYLSPFYSPVLFAAPHVAGGVDPSHAWFGEVPRWWPHRLVSFSPALLILVFPGSFRFTCYYYRKAYYRSFAGSPPGCAVGPLAGRRTYRGEAAILLFQNLHRYALYFALAFIVILGKDAVEAFFRDGVPGIGVGSIILTINVVLIASYTFGCHSFRHLVGGRKDCMSDCGKPTMALGSWRQAGWFNARHMQFAWASLVWVMVADLYVRLLSMGYLCDFHTWHTW
ncbi:MAG: succinate dehydrogenase [Deltaproteobacteria bacterium]|nr:MAG: succinate dehydrogenase [Deltaproteobacteria bacterium]TMQ05799.1 MAG: succinate dehydrogenase [Deltaproteobacteria bacterium]